MNAPRRPFFRRKRWLAAGLLWLAVAYPLSLGPINYAFARGWLPPSVVAGLQGPYRPLRYAGENRLPGTGPLLAYADWAYRLGGRHAASERRRAEVAE